LERRRSRANIASVVNKSPEKVISEEKLWCKVVGGGGLGGEVDANDHASDDRNGGSWGLGGLGEKKSTGERAERGGFWVCNLVWGRGELPKVVGGFAESSLLGHGETQSVDTSSHLGRGRPSGPGVQLEPKTKGGAKKLKPTTVALDGQPKEGYKNHEQ